MAPKLLPLLFGVALGCAVGSLEAAPLSFSVVTAKKRFEVERTGTVSRSFTKEKWAYTIILENKSFQALSDIELQYRQYRFDDQDKGQGKLVSIPGATKIPSLANGAKFKFETDPVVIEKEELKAGWNNGTGGKEKMKDALAGYWLRALKDGQVVFEYQYPADLAKKVKWE